MNNFPPGRNFEMATKDTCFNAVQREVQYSEQLTLNIESFVLCPQAIQTIVISKSLKFLMKASNTKIY